MGEDILLDADFQRDRETSIGIKDHKFPEAAIAITKAVVFEFMLSNSHRSCVLTYLEVATR